MFSTAQYEMAHGVSPRGRGNWAFSDQRSPDILDADHVFWFNGTYSEGKKAARKRFPNAGIIWVMS